MDHNLISMGMFSDEVLELWFALVDNGLEDNLWSQLNLFVTAHSSGPGRCHCEPGVFCHFFGVPGLRRLGPK